MKTDAIRMAEEDLYISRSRINIRYRFVNESGADITQLVAFPVPSIEGDLMANYGGSPSPGDNFLDFTVAINGKQVTPKVETRIEMNGLDVTQSVIRHGVPLNRFHPSYYERVENLPIESKKALLAEGLIEWDPKYPNEVWVKWSHRTTLYWPVTFPAGQSIEMVHTYRPFPGGTFYMTEHVPADYKTRYCMDNGFLRAAERLTEGLEYPQLESADLRYILMTGNNWKGPIGSFRLVIDKENTKSLVSLCIDNIRKIGPTLFEFKAKNFVPDRDLDLLFVERKIYE